MIPSSSLIQRDTPASAISQRGIKRSVAAAALPDHAALIQNPDERMCLAAVTDLDGARLDEPSNKVRVSLRQPDYSRCAR